MPEHDLRIRYGKGVSGQRSSCIRSVDFGTGDRDFLELTATTHTIRSFREYRKRNWSDDWLEETEPEGKQAKRVPGQRVHPV